ncbi:MAG: hypothetical protein ACOC3E_02985 [Cyanobacteriota bacterium]
MSAIRRYRTVQNTVHTVSSQTPIFPVGKVLQTSVNQLSKAGKAIYQTVTASLKAANETIVPSTQTSRQTAQTLQQQALKLTQEAQLPLAEAAQVAGLVAANAYVTANPQTLEAAWKPLQNATSLETAKTALDNFVQQLETTHQQVVVQNLVLACTQAAMKVGFTPLESTTTVVKGTVRLIANDDTGRSLVTEIATESDRPIPLATEIIGSSDESCEAILDAFEAALAEQGVTASPPQRQFTGGICELEAARDFVRQRPIPKATKTGSKSSHKKVVRSSVPQQQIRQG